MTHRGQSTLALQQIAALERSGMPLDQCVASCRDAASSPRLRRWLGAVHQRLRAGDAPSTAFSVGDFVPPDQVGLLRAAERVDATSEALAHAAGVMSLRFQLARTARSILAYPLLLCVLGGTLALFGRLILAEAYFDMSELLQGASVYRPSPVLLPLGIALIAIGIAGLTWLAFGRIPALSLRVPILGNAMRRAILADVLRVVAAASGRTAPLSHAIAAMPYPLTDRVATSLADGVLLEDALIRSGLATEDEAFEIQSTDPEQLARHSAAGLERTAGRVAFGLTVALGVVVYLWMYRALGDPLARLKDLF